MINRIMPEVEHHVLLLYPVGHSDLNLDGEPIPRNSDFRGIVRSLRGEIASDDSPVRDLVCRDDGRLKEVSLPIFVPVIARIQEDRVGLPIRVRFVLSDQRPPHKSDTIGFDRLVASWLATAAGQAACGPDLQIAGPLPLAGNPSSYDHMMVKFGELALELQPELEAANASYYFITTATPAMSFGAATAFGADARIAFLYKSLQPGSRAERIAHFRKLPQERCLHLLDGALARFELTLGHELLTEPGNGFDPNNDDVANARGHLAALESWQDELYAEAARRASAAGLTRQMTELTEVTKRGSAAHALGAGLETLPATPTDGITFWRLKLIDIAARLQIARAQRDIPGFVFRLQQFVDISILYGLCWSDLATDGGDTVPNPRDSQRARESNWGRDNFQPGNNLQRTALLTWWLRRAPANAEQRRRQELATAWLDRFLLLRYLASDELRKYRNEHVHKSWIFTPETLDDFVKREFGLPDPLAPGAGAALIMALVLETLQALPTPAGEAAADVAVTNLLGECLQVPATLAADHSLREPSASKQQFDRLTLPGDPTLARLGPFRAAVAASYARELGRVSAHLLRSIRDAQHQLRQQIVAVTGQPGAALNPDRLAALEAAIAGWDADRLAGMAEIAVIGISPDTLHKGLRTWFRQRVFAEVAPHGMNRARAESLAADFGPAAIPQRTEILAELLS